MTHYKGEEGGILKKGDINRDKVAISIGRITTITPLKARITQEDTLRGFGREFVLPRSKNINKTNTTKDTMMEVKERLSR